MSTRVWTPFLLIFALAHAVFAATVTLTNLPAYQSQRSCAKQCFYIGFSSGGGPDRLADHLDCAVDPIENDCFCRADLQDDADAFVQSCVYDYCSKNTIDVSSAVSIYDSYCTAAGFNRAVETTAAQGNSGMWTRLACLDSVSQFYIDQFIRTLIGHWETLMEPLTVSP